MLNSVTPDGRKAALSSCGMIMIALAATAVPAQACVVVERRGHPADLNVVGIRDRNAIGRRLDETGPGDRNVIQRRGCRAHNIDTVASVQLGRADDLVTPQKQAHLACGNQNALRIARR